MNFDSDDDDYDDYLLYQPRENESEAEGGAEGDTWQCLEPAMVSLKCGKAYNFDTRGDLTLEVGEDEEDGAAYEFVVCSRTLARWSPAFNTMLFSGFAESQPNDGAWHVRLPADGPQPLFLVLAILHGYFEHVPKSLSKHELYQVLVVTEKYDMTRIVRPWARTWFSPYKNASSIEGNEILLWISWELGASKTFRWLAMDLQLKSEVNEKGELIGSDGNALSTYTCLEPPGIIESITRSRKSCIGQITAVLYETVRNAYSQHVCVGNPAGRKCSKCGLLYPSGDDPLTCTKYSYSVCRGTLIPVFQVAKNLCGNLIFGSLVNMVDGIDLHDVAFLINATPKYQGSINQLSSKIETMHLEIPSEHAACNPLPKMQAKIDALVRDVWTPVTDMHVKYLKSQAKKTGIY